MPVTFGILTTIVAFIPLMFIEGFLGPGFAGGHGGHSGAAVFAGGIKADPAGSPGQDQAAAANEQATGFTAWQRRVAKRFEIVILEYYQPFLKFALRHRWSTLATFTGVLIVMITLVTSGWTRFVFFPSVESETATATLEMPVGTPFEVTSRHADRLFQAAYRLQEKYAGEAGRRRNDHQRFFIGRLHSRQQRTSPGRNRFETAPRETRTSDLTVTELY